MSKSRNAPPVHAAPEPVDWAGTQTQRVEYTPETTIFAQGDPATSVMYVEGGKVRLSVLSHAGKEAVVADTSSVRAAWPGNPSAWPRRRP